MSPTLAIAPKQPTRTGWALNSGHRHLLQPPRVSARCICAQLPSFGWSIAIALSQAGANVTGVARDRAGLEELRGLLGDGFTPVVADAADPFVDPRGDAASALQRGGAQGLAGVRRSVFP